jgi:hypothetical protein
VWPGLADADGEAELAGPHETSPRRW